MKIDGIKRAALKVGFYGLTMVMVTGMLILLAGGAFSLLSESAAPFVWGLSGLLMMLGWQELAPKLAKKLGVE